MTRNSSCELLENFYGFAVSQGCSSGVVPQVPRPITGDPFEKLKSVAEIDILVENPVPNFYRNFLGETARPHIEEIARTHEVPFYYRTLDEWGLNDGHFFGARNYDLYKLDWLHLNFPGSRIYSQEIGKIIAKEIRGE